MEVLVVLWVLFAFVPAILAYQKGRNALGWFMLALVLSPLLALLFVAVLPNLYERRERASRVPCPFCKELIKRDTVRCPHCRSDLAVEPPATTRRPTRTTPTLARRLGAALGRRHARRDRER
jgi:Na+/melibiose symporter-like transporter